MSNNYRVDETSNFADETYAESTKIDWLTKEEADQICEILNRRAVGDTYYQVRERTERLWRGMEELI